MTIVSDDPALENRSTVFLSLLPPLHTDRRLALTLAALSAVVFFVLAPFAQVPLTPIAAFIPTYQAALFMSDLITAAVLFGQFSIQRTRSILLLATAYLFTAIAIIPHTLSFPGLFAPAGFMGSGPQTTVWLYMLWHGGFPLLIIAYAFVKHDSRRLVRPLRVALAGVAIAIGCVAGFTFLTTAGHTLLPTLLLPDNTYTTAMQVVIFSVWALSAVALVTLWLRPPHTALDLWIMVVMVAWTCDVGLSAALNGKRFDLGFYAGRAFGLAAATFVLTMLILETRNLYARLARSLNAKRAAAETRADRAQRISHEAAETLRAVIDSSTQSVLALSPQGQVLLWNKTAEKMFGYRSDEVVGYFYPLLPQSPNAREEQKEVFDRALAGASLRGVDIQCRGKNGTETVTLGSSTPFFDESKALRGIALVLEDLTDKRTTEDMLRQAQKMEAVGQLTGGVAHDFNNILMVILANVEELLEDGALTPTHRSMLTSISTSGQRAAELTKRLLAFSRKQRLQPLDTNLTDLVAGIDKLLRRSLGEHIEIEAIFADDLWITSVDRPQVEAALVNLCVNARDAMPTGGKLLIETGNVELDLDYTRANAGVVPGQYVMLAVSDTGSGMPAEILQRVFEPFFTTKEVGKGTGLGLSMVYGFIKQSNGHIKIYSEVGRGTTIRMYLPRNQAATTGNVDGQQAAAPRGIERILLVEDDTQVQATVRRQLAGLGYIVTEVSTGPEALALIDRGETFALVVSDVIMPTMSGPMLAEELRRRDRSARILFMSGYSENAAHLHGHLNANVRLLSKPFRKIDLARRIREVLDLPAEAQSNSKAPAAALSTVGATDG